MIEQYLKLKYGQEFYDYNYEELLVKHAADITRLNNGEPLHKVLGYIEMSDLKIDLSQNVLIPRYETEELVNLALKNIKEGDDILDLCSGSGYIGLAVKKTINTQVTMSDISKAAVKQCQINAQLNNLKVKIIQSDLFNKIEGKFNVIICNPPYIPSGEELDKSVLNYEPNNALFSGQDGLDIIKLILNSYKNYLKETGVILFEIHDSQAKFMSQQGFQIYQDINKKNRFAVLDFS